MKFFYKFLVLGVFLTVVAVISPVLGQDVCANYDANIALYEKYINNYKGDLTNQKIAVSAGNEYIQTYSACDAFKQQVVYLKKAVPKLQASVEELSRYVRFDTALRNAPAIKNVWLDAQAKAASADEKAKADAEAKLNKSSAEWTGVVNEIFLAGKDILKYEPEKLDVLIALSTVGLDEVAEHKDNSNNNDSMNYAKSAIRLMKGTATSTDYGVLQYAYKSKDNALGWMNYTIGYITHFGLKNKEAALPYFYQATQEKSETKDRYFIYKLIGDYYRDKAVKIGDDIVAKLKKNKELEPTADPDTYETKMMFALQKGYAERTIDAYARAYSVGKSSKSAAKQEYLDDLKLQMETFYKFRFVTEENPLTDINSDLMSYVSSVSSKPFPNPTSEVQPVDPPSMDEKASETVNSTSPTNATMTSTKPQAKATVAVPANGAKGQSEADTASNKPD